MNLHRHLFIVTAFNSSLTQIPWFYFIQAEDSVHTIQVYFDVVGVSYKIVFEKQTCLQNAESHEIISTVDQIAYTKHVYKCTSHNLENWLRQTRSKSLAMSKNIYSTFTFKCMQLADVLSKVPYKKRINIKLKILLGVQLANGKLDDNAQ